MIASLYAARCAALLLASAPAVVALTPTSVGHFREGLHVGIGHGHELQSQRQILAQESSVQQREPAAATGENYCYSGKLLPEFYLLGAKNTATTSISQDLRNLGVKAAPRDHHKEWNFFKGHAGLSEAEQFDQWLGKLPPCPAEPGSIMADFSVTSMVTIPLPADFVWSQEFGYPAKHQSEFAWDTARLLHDWHSLAEGPMPKMIVLLREPLARMQSEYYHTLPRNNCMGCMANGSFAESFAFNVELLQKSPVQMTDWAWKSFYARQIENFLQYFDASEFLFVPNREYFEIDPQGFSTSLLKWLGVPGEPWVAASHDNAHSIKPPLDEELPPSAPARLAYQVLMAPEEDRLVQVLASAHAQGAALAGYTGPQGNKTHIRAWLEAGW